MNTQLSGPKHARADVGRAHRGRSLLAAAAASLVALTGLSGIALASDEDETTNPSTSTSSSQIGATEGAPPDETQPTGDAGTISSGTAGGASTAPEDSATAGTPGATADTDVPAAPEPTATTPTKAPASIQSSDLQVTPLAAGSNLSCDAQSVYSVLSDGTLRQVSIGTTTTVTSKAAWSGQSDYPKNGLAISAGGTAAYILARKESSGSSTRVAVAKYSPTTDSWAQVKPSNGFFNLNTEVGIVADAVDISSSSGAYYFGGYESRTRSDTILFHLWKMDTTTFSITKVGTVDTGLPSNLYSSPNGDMAFDAAGNLYIVRSGYSGTNANWIYWTNTTNIISVTSSALSSANGGPISSSSSTSKASALDSVNGIAFAADGSVYMGNETSLSEFNPSTWAKIKDVTPPT